MSLKVTILNAVNVAELRLKRGVKLAEVKEQLGVTTSKIGGAAWGAASDGLLKKTKGVGTTGNQNTYSVTAKGKKFLAKNTSLVWSVDKILKWEKGTISGTSSAPKAPSSSRYSGQALGAMDGIVQLIETNDILMNSLRSIHSQIGTLIEEHDNEPSQNLDS